MKDLGDSLVKFVRQKILRLLLYIFLLTANLQRFFTYR